MSRIKVVVADDDDAMRQAMIDVLESHGGFEVVAALVDGRELATVVQETSPDVVLIDVRMPYGGVAAVTELVALTPVPVVAVSATTDIATVAALLRAGAAGYLTKGHLGRTFPEDVIRCAVGHVILAIPRAAHVLRLLASTGPGESAG